MEEILHGRSRPCVKRRICSRSDVKNICLELVDVFRVNKLVVDNVREECGTGRPREPKMLYYWYLQHRQATCTLQVHGSFTKCWGCSIRLQERERVQPVPRHAYGFRAQHSRYLRVTISWQLLVDFKRLQRSSGMSWCLSRGVFLRPCAQPGLFICANANGSFVAHVCPHPHIEEHWKDPTISLWLLPRVRPFCNRLLKALLIGYATQDYDIVVHLVAFTARMEIFSATDTVAYASDTLRITHKVKLAVSRLWFRWFT